jgi:hypothetical protein
MLSEYFEFQKKNRSFPIYWGIIFYYLGGHFRLLGLIYYLLGVTFPFNWGYNMPTFWGPASI